MLQRSKNDITSENTALRSELNTNWICIMPKIAKQNLISVLIFKQIFNSQTNDWKTHNLTTICIQNEVNKKNTEQSYFLESYSQMKFSLFVMKKNRGDEKVITILEQSILEQLGILLFPRLRSFSYSTYIIEVSSNNFVLTYFINSPLHFPRIKIPHTHIHSQSHTHTPYSIIIHLGENFD